MRLLKIELENFGSHQNSSIDLSSITSATVSGKNGSGKSTAFVDAVLWALFGKCRSDADAMMTHEKDRMTVRIEFSLDGQIYRVARMRSKATKAGKSELTFQAVNEGGQAVAIGGHKLTETQEAIKSVLNADYDLCATSNFLIQGKADKFSTATPAERKAIMAQVLRLDEYATLKTMANKRGLVLDVKLSTLLAEEKELKEKSDSILGLKNEIKLSEEAVQKAGERVIDIGNKLKAHFETKGKKQTDFEAILDHKKALNELVEEQRQTSDALRNYENNAARFKTLVDNKDEINEAEVQFKQLAEILEASKHRETELLQNKGKVDQELSKVKERKATEEQTLERCKLELVALEGKKQHAMDRQAIAIKEVQQELVRSAEKGELLQKVPCWKELQDKCQFTIDAVAALEGMEGKKTALAKIEERDFVMEELPNYEKDRQHREQQITNLGQSIISEQVNRLQKTSDDLEQEIKDLLFRRDPVMVDHDRLKAKAELKSTLDSSIKELEQLKGFIEETKRRLGIVNDKIMTSKNVVEEEAMLKDWISNAVKVEQELQSAEERANSEITEHTGILGKKRHLLAEAELAQSSLVQNRTAFADQQLRREACTKLVEYYTTIPVMIMEQAVPTLEATANGILEKISSSGMRIRLDTQKALKSSDRLAETLDIIVRDVFGEKPYENYSGGERFRLDLALRFGLSQLLMHRAGSKMETLIIDEGLGSLDGDGLALLRECLGKLETSFGLILVISHVEEIQGTFEQEIMVEKNAFGSQIKIL